MSRVSKAHHCRSSAGSLDASRLIKGQRVGGSSIAGPNEAMVCLLTSELEAARYRLDDPRRR
jgi:hypothetical protein